MTEIQEEQYTEEAVSEQPEGETLEQQEEQKMVPLAAMLATRKKAQEAEERAQKAEAAAEAYRELMSRNPDKQTHEESEEDLSALVEKKHLYEANAMAKREILETLYQDMNPEAVQQINKHLKTILEKKPWLASTIGTATNRYARAHEIVQDYIHLVEERPKISNQKSDAKRIIENSQKPGSPADVGKSASPKGVEYLKSIQGKKEFREYRRNMLRG